MPAPRPLRGVPAGSCAALHLPEEMHARAADRQRPAARFQLDRMTLDFYRALSRRDGPEADACARRTRGHGAGPGNIEAQLQSENAFANCPCVSTSTSSDGEHGVRRVDLLKRSAIVPNDRFGPKSLSPMGRPPSASNLQRRTSVRRKAVAHHLNVAFALVTSRRHPQIEHQGPATCGHTLGPKNRLADT